MSHIELASVRQIPRPEKEPGELHIQFIEQAARLGLPRRLIAAKMHIPLSRLNNWLRRGTAALMDEEQAEGDRPPTESMILLAEAFQNGEADRTMALLGTVHAAAEDDPKVALALLERTVPEFQRRTAVASEVAPASGREALIQNLKALKAGGE